MTREEAIAYFIDSNERIISVAKDENRYNYETQQIEDVFMRKDFEAKDIAIKALKQEPCEDCISKKAVLDKINEICFSREQASVDFRVAQGSNGQRDLIINFIENLPSVQSKPKTEVLNKIRAEIDRQEKWLMSAGCNAYNVDIAFNSIRSVVKESEE